MKQELIAQLLLSRKDALFGNNDYDQEIVTALIGTEDSCYDDLAKLPLRNPSLIQVLSILPGAIDRLLLGKYGTMILKNLTLGGFGIWWIKDIFSAKTRCREHNQKRFLKAINDPSIAKRIISAEEKAKLAFDFTKEVAPTIIEGAKNIGSTFSVK